MTLGNFFPIRLLSSFWVAFSVSSPEHHRPKWSRILHRWIEQTGQCLHSLNIFGDRRGFQPWSSYIANSGTQSSQRGSLFHSLRPQSSQKWGKLHPRPSPLAVKGGAWGTDPGQWLWHRDATLALLCWLIISSEIPIRGKCFYFNHQLLWKNCFHKIFLDLLLLLCCIFVVF